MESDFDSGMVPHPGFYAGNEQSHEHIWAFQERPMQSDFYGNGPYHTQEPSSIVDESTASLTNRYLKQEEPPVISLNDQPPPYFTAETADSSTPSYAHLQGHDSASMTADLGYAFDQSIQPQGYGGGGSPSFTITSDPNLQYPPPTEAVPRFVSPARLIATPLSAAFASCLFHTTPSLPLTHLTYRPDTAHTFITSLNWEEAAGAASELLNNFRQPAICTPSSRTSTRLRSARQKPNAFARSTPIVSR